MAVKCSSSLFQNIKNHMMSTLLTCQLLLLHRQLLPQNSLCCTVVKITKTSQETRNLFRAYFLLAFQALQDPSRNIRSFLRLVLESSIYSLNIRYFFRAGFSFIFFFELGKLLPEMQKVFFSFSSSFLILELKGSISQYIRKYKNFPLSAFFQFSELGPKVCKVALFYTTVILTKYSASAVIIVSYNLYVALRTEISYYNYNNSLML